MPNTSRNITPRNDDNDGVAIDIAVALIGMITGIIPVIAHYIYTHPNEWNIAKRRTAAHLFRRCERLAIFWWDKALSCATYYDKLRP